MPYPYKSFRDWLQEEEERGAVLRIKAPIKCGDYSSIVDIGNSIPGKQPEKLRSACPRPVPAQPAREAHRHSRKTRLQPA